MKEVAFASPKFIHTVGDQQLLSISSESTPFPHSPSSLGQAGYPCRKRTSTTHDLYSLFLQVVVFKYSEMLDICRFTNTQGHVVNGVSPPLGAGTARIRTEREYCEETCDALPHRTCTHLRASFDTEKHPFSFECRALRSGTLFHEFVYFYTWKKLKVMHLYIICRHVAVPSVHTPSHNCNTLIQLFDINCRQYRCIIAEPMT
jgi:hypothetical protein